MALGVQQEARRIAAARAPSVEARQESGRWRCNDRLAEKILLCLTSNGFEAPSALARKSLQTGEPGLLQDALNAASERVRQSLHALPLGTKRSTALELGGLGFELHQLSRQLYEERLSARAGALAAVQSALRQLRGLDDTASVMKTATAGICAAGGFDRAMLFRVERSQMVAEAVHFGSDYDWAAAVLDFARRTPPDLTEMIIESELARRRLPGSVEKPQRDPRAFRPLVLATDTQSYIAAPIAPEGRVIGFLHADCYFSRRCLDGADRDLLAAFAEGLGYATANAALRERLRTEGRALGTLLRRTGEAIDELADGEADLAPPPPTHGRGRRVQRPDAAPAMTPLRSLSGRQLEVLRLLAEGATNAEIATRLVISHHTVKSHIKHILRELGAANRTEAAACYFRLAR